MKAIYGAIEAGGTKFVCGVAEGPETFLAERTFPTTGPVETLGRVEAFFREVASAHGPLAGIGIASFGPIDCRLGSPTFGRITTTPKEGWRQTDVVGPFRKAFGVPVGFDTDVSGAALAEWRWGAAKGLGSCLYVTVGTGIGGGFVLQGETLKGLLHPEMGHVRVIREPGDDFEGNCPFHGATCLEGMASGPAIERRWNRSAAELPSAHQSWIWECNYLAQAIVNWVLTLSPEVIVLGGGVMQQGHLFPPIRRRVRELLNDYVQAPEILEEPPTYIREPGLGTRSGLIGALALGMDACS